MRNIVNAPIFLRLGARMRSPEGTPVGTMKRILISDINVWNADSRYASIINGVPGACIEDVTFRNIHLYYKGGYSEEDGKRIPPEQGESIPRTLDVRHYSRQRVLYPPRTEHYLRRHPLPL